MLHEFQTYIRDRIAVDANGCWIWQLSKDRDGYGAGCFKKRKSKAHRLSHEAFKGPIAPGMHTDHLCRVRACVNPDHLEVVTAGENIRRGNTGSSERTHCKRGHAFEQDGRKDTTGWNQCRVCDRMRSNAWYAENRAKPRPTQYRKRKIAA